MRIAFGPVRLGSSSPRPRRQPGHSQAGGVLAPDGAAAAGRAGVREDGAGRAGENAAGAGGARQGGAGGQAGMPVPLGRKVRWRRRPGARGADIVAGRVFARLTLAPPLLVLAWLLPGLPALLAGGFTGTLMFSISAVLVLAVVIAVLANAPVPWPHRRTPWWTVAAVTVIAAGFGVWQAAMHSEQVIVRRDPAAYLQFAYWISQHGSLPLPLARSAFGGGPLPGLAFQSLGFYAHGAAVVPQFMAGLPMLLAAAFWLGGIQFAMLTAPVLGACAVLVFGGLVARLCGPRWAPLGALVLALSLPEIYTSRTTFSEPLAQIMLFGGLCLVTDALWLSAAARRGGTGAQRARVPRGRAPQPQVPTPAAPVPPPVPQAREAENRELAAWVPETLVMGTRAARRRMPGTRTDRAVWLLAGIGGIALGMSALVRIDGLSDILPAVAFCGVLLATRRGAVALPLAVGLAIGAGYGLADGYLLSRPYLDSLSATMRPLGYAAAAFAAVTAALVVLSRRRRLPGLSRGRWRWLPDAAALAVLAGMAGFAVRPLVQTVRGETNPVTVAFIAEVQKLAGLPIDPHRTYAEDSLYWVIWYIGVPAVLLGTFGAALLTRRFLRGSALIWGLPVMIIGWATATTLWRPGIVPDQPWASRRLVPVVLPGLVLLAVWAAGWLVGRARQRGAERPARLAVAGCCALALLLPTAVTSFGLGLGWTPNGRLKIVAVGLALKRTDTGEIAVVDQLCRAIGPGAAVVIVDPLTADRFTQIVRGMCATPVARLDAPTLASVGQAVAAIQRAGRRPVLLAGQQAQLTPYGGSISRVVYRATRQDEHRLTEPPATTWRILFEVWMSGGQPPAG